MRNLSCASTFFLSILAFTGCDNLREVPPLPPDDVGLAEQSGPAAVKREPLKIKGWASLSGFVKYDGTPPKLDEDPRLAMHSDSAVCCAPSIPPMEKAKQDWIVDQTTGGVANVVVFLKPVDNTKYFPIDDKDKKITKPVVLDQPHCAYVPHVVVLFPEYPDGAKMVKTGQEFIVRNSAPILHNTKFSVDIAKNRAIGKSLAADSVWTINTESKVDLKPQDTPVTIACDVHKWMRAYGWVFEHPYAAVTGGGRLHDKSADFGAFSIPRVPAGVPVRVVVWHEGDFLNSQGFNGPDGKIMTFEDGKPVKLEIDLK